MELPSGSTEGQKGGEFYTPGGDWRASSLVAGIRDTSANGFGNADDTGSRSPAGADTDAIVARIASVTIKGTITGTGNNPADPFDFAAQQIGAFKLNGAKLAPTSDADPAVLLAPLTADVFLREV